MNAPDPMPTALREGPYRVHFYAADRLREPPHMHVRRDRSEAKFWLDPVRLERGGPGTNCELLEEREQELLDFWYGYP